MQVIPVIDLKGRVAVHAVRGQRGRYRVLQSCLGEAASLPALVANLLKFFPFKTLYIADLDAITGGNAQHDMVLEVVEEFPHIECWLDAGFADRDDLAIFGARERVRIILGAESQRSLTAYRSLLEHCDDPVLSLDYQDGRALGPAALYEDSSCWPNTVIAMNLTNVGAQCGPDIELLSQLKRCARQRHLVAAGGVRHRSDLLQLAKLGIAHVLVATALHQGHLSARDLQAVATASETRFSPPD